MEEFLIYAIAVNVAAFLMYGIDKWKAQHDVRRIPEKMLIGIAVVGGSAGAYLGMQMFRHKTRKPKFYIGIPLIFLIQLIILKFIYY